MLVLMTTTLMVSAPILCIGGITMAMQQDPQLSWLIAVSVPYPHRSAGAAGDERAAGRAHQPRDRAPALHNPRRRPYPRDGGWRIVEQGTHAQLLAAEGAYFGLYNAQFAAPVADEV
jgi:hypothetical protein